MIPTIALSLKDGRVVTGAYLGAQDGFVFVGQDDGIEIVKQSEIVRYLGREEDQ